MRSRATAHQNLLRLIGAAAVSAEVGILGLLRVPVVQVMTPAIGRQVEPERRGAEPGPDPIVGRLAREQQPVRGLVHQHGQTELTAADDEDAETERQRGGPDGTERITPAMIAHA